MQQDVLNKVSENYRLANAQRDVGHRISILLQAQELLLHADVSTETIDACLEQFLNLQADPQPAARRYVAHFIERLLRFKPGFALKCIPGLLGLLKDTDSKAREAAARAASVLHPRALYALALDEQAPTSQNAFEQFQEVQEAMRDMLQSGCPQQAKVFAAAAKWAKVQVLTQTPSAVAAKVRIPPELRGVSSLDEIPFKARDAQKQQQFDISSLRQQAEDLVVVICQLVEQPPKGRWSRAHIGALLRSMSSIGRQRPMFLRKILDTWEKLLAEVNSAITGKPSALGPMIVVPVDAPHLQHLLRVELQSLLASQLTVERHGEIVTLLHETGQIGSVEDLVVQAKYEQIRNAAERQAEEPAAKRLKLSRAPKLAWVPAGDAAFGDIDCFDADALVSGEIEETWRNFELHFGIPSQREPAGHVSGPALLLTRSKGVADLARLSVTSLSLLHEKRTLLRERLHERVVNLEDAMRIRSAAASQKSSKGRKNIESQVSKFLGPDVPEFEERAGDGEAADPRVGGATKALQLMDASMLEVGDAAVSSDQLMVFDSAALQLPADKEAQDGLQIQLFQEIMEASKRLSSSLLCSSMSTPQLQTFDFMYRQVSLHIAASIKLGVNADLQRAMCRSYLTHAFDTLQMTKEGLELGKLTELFYAKFSADMARAEAAAGDAGLSEAAISDVLEGNRSDFARFSYSDLFSMFESEFDRRNLPKKELKSFLKEIPAVPTRAFSMLEAHCHHEKTRKTALVTVLVLMERPCCRWPCMDLLFKLAYSAGSGEDASKLRLDAIRLLINKVYSAEAAKPKRWQFPHLSEAEATATLAQATAAEHASGNSNDFSMLRGVVVEDVATRMLRSAASKTARFAAPVEVSQRTERLLQDLMKGAVCDEKDRLVLFAALCIKRPAMLHAFVETFTQCTSEMQAHLIESIEESIRNIDSKHPELLVLVQRATSETEELVLKVLHILSSPSKGKDGLPKAFGAAVTRLYSETQNPRLLVPVFGLLERRNLLDFLPAVVQLDHEEVTNAFQHLIRAKAPPLTASELLTELHHLNKPGEDIVPTKSSMQALNAMFAMKEEFDSKVYGIVIQSLVEEGGPLPTLFMRTVIQVVKEVPRLVDYVVMEILPRLVKQVIWNNESMWKGFVLVLQHIFPTQPSGAARVLAMLPHQKLEDVLVQHPDWKAHLRDYVAKQPMGNVPPHVRQLLQ
mmetsp:Transcript_75992/g.180795  ORF Transcript_75992/g.180795 Transcript_75992/m.180795 type:complete len:1199 (-) Transcript_75992:54-3650(-)